MNEKEIIRLIRREAEKLYEGVSSFSEYLIVCTRLDTLHDQLIDVISSKNNMKKTVKPAKKATKKVVVRIRKAKKAPKKAKK